MELYNDILKYIRKFKLELLFSFVFTCIFSLGYILNTYDTVDINPLGGRLLTVYIFTSILLWCALFWAFVFLRHRIEKKIVKSRKPLFKNISDKRFFLFTWLAIITLSSPLILLSVGTMTTDSWSSVSQVAGSSALSSAHPIIFTGFVSIFLTLGHLLGSMHIGILLFSLTQSAILAAIFSVVITWMRKERFSNILIFSSFIFYSIIPINAMAGLNMWKDILFAGIGLLLLMILRSIYVKRSEFFTKKNVLYFTLLVFLFCTWRNNGLYAYLLATPLIILSDRKVFFNKKYLALFVTPILLVGVYLLSISFLATPPSSAESMSIPMQQLTRTAKYHQSSISEEDYKMLNKILPLGEVTELYDPNLSDPVKGRIILSELNANKGDYMKLWVSLLVRYPKTFIAATAYNTFGYIYPMRASPTTTDLVIDNDTQLFVPKDYVDDAYDNGNKRMVEEYRNILRSIFPLAQNIGLYTCIILLSLYITILRRRFELTGAFILLAALLVSVLLGPVNGEFRYLYLFVISSPFILASSLYPASLQKK